MMKAIRISTLLIVLTLIIVQFCYFKNKETLLLSDHIYIASKLQDYKSLSLNMLSQNFEKENILKHGICHVTPKLQLLAFVISGRECNTCFNSKIVDLKEVIGRFTGRIYIITDLDIKLVNAINSELLDSGIIIISDNNTVNYFYKVTNSKPTYLLFDYNLNLKDFSFILDDLNI